MKIVKKAVYVLMRGLDFILQFTLPTFRNRVCYVSYPDYADNAYYIYRHILETRSGIEHVWLFNDVSVAERIAREFTDAASKTDTSENVLHLARKYSIKGYFLYLTSRIIFHSHGGYPFSSTSIRRVNVSLWHGMPIKCVGRLNRITPNPFPTYGSIHFATSHLFKYIIAAAFNIDAKAVKVCSLPRCDVLKHKSVLTVERETIRGLLQVPSGRRLVLWMPTYRTETPSARPSAGMIRSFLDDLPSWVLQTMDQACAENNCEVIVKLHPMDLLNYQQIPLSMRHIRLLKSNDWLRYEVQLYDLIAASDALISDVSSVLIDYLVTGRPVGILGFNETTYTRDLTIPMEYLFESSRFMTLADVSRLIQFFKKTAAGSSAASMSPNDLASVLYGRFEEKGSEAVLREVTLYDNALERVFGKVTIDA